MPNWIINKITSSNMNELKKLLLNEKGEVDFEKIERMPNDLNITAGGRDYGESLFFPDSPDKKLIRDTIDAVLKNLYDKTISRDSFVDKVMKYKKIDVVKLICSLQQVSKKDKESIRIYIAGFYNLKKHGAINWYDWHNKHWGTKWNGCDTYVGDNFIEFSTAWATPEPIFLKLSKKIPLTVAYGDEDVFGENAGIVDYENGIAERRDNVNLVALSCALHGRCAEDYGCDDDDCSECSITQEEIDKAEKELNSIFGA